MKTLLKVLLLVVVAVADGKISDATYEMCRQKLTRCVHLPDNCLSTEDCTMIATSKPGKPGRVDFGLYGEAQDDEYLAVGVSETMSMENAFVMFCFNSQNQGQDVRASLNTAGHENEIYETNLHHSLTDIEFSLVDGLLSCNWSKIATASHDHNGESTLVDLNQPQYLLIAKGSISYTETIEGGIFLNYHNNDRMVGEDPLILTQETTIAEATTEKITTTTQCSTSTTSTTASTETTASTATGSATGTSGSEMTTNSETSTATSTVTTNSDTTSGACLHYGLLSAYHCTFIVTLVTVQKLMWKFRQIETFFFKETSPSLPFLKDLKENPSWKQKVTINDPQSFRCISVMILMVLNVIIFVYLTV